MSQVPTSCNAPFAKVGRRLAVLPASSMTAAHYSLYETKASGSCQVCNPHYGPQSDMQHARQSEHLHGSVLRMVKTHPATSFCKPCVCSGGNVLLEVLRPTPHHLAWAVALGLARECYCLPWSRSRSMHTGTAKWRVPLPAAAQKTQQSLMTTLGSLTCRLRQPVHYLSQHRSDSALPCSSKAYA